MDANLVRHDAASIKYNRDILGPRFSDEGFVAVPFNETPEWNSPLGKKHWFEIPLACGKVRRDTSLEISGRLFTTAMPRNVDECWPELDVNGKYPPWLIDPIHVDAMNASRQHFKSKVGEYDIRNVIVLAMDKELEAAGSKRLFEFYAALGLHVVRCPTYDFNCPNPDAFKKAIELLTLSLYNGRSTIMHCWGGSGRTGMYVIGVLKNFGAKDPLEWARQVGKSVYVDVKEQELFLSQMQVHITQRMVETNRDLVITMIDSHLKRLAEIPGSGDLERVDRNLDSETEAIVRNLAGEKSEAWSTSLVRNVPICTPLTAPYRAHMEAGNGAIGSYPLPSPEGDADRQPTPLAVAGDYWSNTLDGYCQLEVPRGSVGAVPESVLWA